MCSVYEVVDWVGWPARSSALPWGAESFGKERGLHVGLFVQGPPLSSSREDLLLSLRTVRPLPEWAWEQKAQGDVETQDCPSQIWPASVPQVPGLWNERVESAILGIFRVLTL